MLVFEIATQALLDAFFTSDEFVFQVLEKDPNIKRRFEEEASAELQQGWDRSDKAKEREDEERVRAVVGLLEEREERRREGEVVEILRMRAGHDDVGGNTSSDHVEASRILSRGYGDVKAA